MTATHDYRYVVYERDADGVPFSIEIVEASGWDPSVLEAPAPERADARLVRLRGIAPSATDRWPRWLRVEARADGLAEGRASYSTDGASSEVPAHGDEGASAQRIGEIGRSLWPWSPGCVRFERPVRCKP